MTTWNTETEGLRGPVAAKTRRIICGPDRNELGTVLGQSLARNLRVVSKDELHSVVMPSLRDLRPDLFDGSEETKEEAIWSAAFQGFIYPTEDGLGYDVINNAKLREKLLSVNKQD